MNLETMGEILDKLSKIAQTNGVGDGQLINCLRDVNKEIGKEQQEMFLKEYNRIYEVINDE